MSYFVWHTDYDLAGQFAFFDEHPDEVETSEWTTGERMSKEPAPFVMESSPEYTDKLSDVLLFRIEVLALSPAFVDCLTKADATNIDYYPITVKQHKSGSEVTSYRACNILGSIACLDKENAEITYSSSDSKGIIDVEEFSILDEKIAEAAAAGQPTQLFRLAEVPAIILVHESVMEAIEAAGLTGSKFTEPPEYLGI